MEKKEVLLSVIIPVYNAEKTIGRALDTLLGQSLENIEIICVDDGSKDASVQIVEKYAEKDGRVRLLRQQNLFAGIARNNGMDAAKGTYLFFLDADDSVTKYGLEAALNKCVKYQLDCIRFRSLTLDEGTNRFIRNARNDLSRLEAEDFNRLLELKEDSPLLAVSVAPWSGMYRKAFLEERGCRFNGLRCVNDRSFFNQVITAGGRYMCSLDRVTVHRINQSDSLIGQKANHFDCQIESLKITEAQLKESGAAPETAELIMRQEYQDLLVWYGKYMADPDRKAKMDGKIRAYTEEGISAYGGILKKMLEELNPEEIQPAEAREDDAVHEAAEKPIVTVTVPVRNAEDTLNRTLECLSRQTLEEMEFILADEGSADGSMTIMKEYAETDKRFRIAEKGKEEERKARGKYSFVLEPGEYPEPGKYELAYLKEAGPAVRLMHKVKAGMRLAKEQGIKGVASYMRGKRNS